MTLDPYLRLLRAIAPGVESAALHDAAGAVLGCAAEVPSGGGAAGASSIVPPSAAVPVVHAADPTECLLPLALRPDGRGAWLRVRHRPAEAPDRLAARLAPVLEVLTLAWPGEGTTGAGDGGASRPRPAASPTSSSGPAPSTPSAPSSDADGRDLRRARRGGSLEPMLPWLVRDLRVDGALAWVPDAGLTVHDVPDAGALPERAALVELAGILWPAIRARRRAVILNRFRRADGAPAEPMRLLCAPLRHAGHARGLVLAWIPRGDRRFDADDARRLDRAARLLAEAVEPLFDEATGLPTHAGFEARLRAERARGPAESRWLAYGNVDRFHVVNEAVGLAAGDAILRAVAERWSGCGLPAGSFVGRLSGDRFVACLAAARPEDARDWAERVRDALAAGVPAAPGLAVSISIGLAALERDQTTSAALAAAETACKAAKDRGRGRVEVYADNDASLIQRRIDVHRFNDVRIALAEGRFEFLAQPICSLRDPGAAPQYELLVRMRATDGTLLEPAEFLSAATRYQLLGSLDLWVLDAAVAALEAHANAAATGRTTFWINVSGQSLGAGRFVDAARERLRRTPLPPGTVGFEITENVAIGRIEEARRFIAAMRELGAPVKLDDFGTGLCSLAYLRELAVNGVKIDGAFVRALDVDPRAAKVMGGLLRIAAEVGLETTAECVETHAVALRLASMGVDYGQGFALGRPLPLAALWRRTVPRIPPAA